MKRQGKPVRKCHACRLNLGDHCWLYRYPRGQWAHGRQCPGSDNEALTAQYEEWLKEPSVKTRKELRREFFRGRRRTELYHEPVASKAQRTGRTGARS